MTKKKKNSFNVDEDGADVDGAGMGPHGQSLHPPGLDLTLRQYTKPSKVGHLLAYSAFFSFLPKILELVYVIYHNISFYIMHTYFHINHIFFQKEKRK